jgi:hypothetical protein
MNESNDEIARRVLASALERLEASAGSTSPQSGGSDIEEPAQSFSTGDPLVVLVLGGTSPTAARPKESRRTPDNEPLIQEVGSNFGKSIHPGLEKFEFPKTNTNTNTNIITPAPKTCFMEPDRPCVNSGACEMRGY